MITKARGAAVPVLLFLAMSPASSLAQGFPAKPIEVVVPFAPGGSIDITVRLVAPVVSKQLGQPLIVINRAGGMASIGMNVVAKAAADGYTLGAASFAFAANPPFMGSKLPFDPIRDFTPVTQIAQSALAILVNPAVPARSLKELIALAKSRPGDINYGSVGIASSGHLATELFSDMAGIRMTHVPYTTGPLPALAANQIQLQFGPIPSSMPFIKSGKIIPLAVTSLKPDPTLPGVPPVTEIVPGFEFYEWPGLLAPAGTPDAVVRRLQQEVARSLTEPEVSKRLAALGSEPVGSTPAEFARHIRKELDTWAKVAKIVMAAEAKANK